MELLLLNREFESIKLIDAFESLIWTERYSKAGDFELYTPANDDLVNSIKRGFYLWNRDSDEVMIVEKVQISTDIETGTHLIYGGRSLESIIDRRIVWKQTILNGNLQNGIEKLLNENVINPSISDRKIPNFVFERSTDESITKLTIRAQFTGDNLYDTITSICDSYNIGYTISLNDNNQFVFKLYSGVDRSYDQNDNPYVVFSPSFENISDSNYLESDAAYKNVALVAGEDEGTSRRTQTVGSESGLDRKELFVDARDIQSDTDDGKIPDSEYNDQLRQRGLEKLDENQFIKAFEGGGESTKIFVYGRDFFKGDIVQIVNEYGIEAKARITEFVRSQDQTGYNTYPTFAALN